MRSPEYNADQTAELLRIARRAIEQGLETGTSPTGLGAELDPALLEHRASFVTLTCAGELRGCTGSLEASRPLADEVAGSAYQTAFSDPRFPPVTAPALPEIRIEVSVLSPLTPLAAADEASLLTRLRPGEDGLLLVAGFARATFLPKVWDNLPEPTRFLGELKRKAGLPVSYWSPEMSFYRYQTQTFSESG